MGKRAAIVVRNPHISGFPLWDDVRILKVSEVLDSKNNWFYEDIEEDFELPQKMLSTYITQLVKSERFGRWRALKGVDNPEEREGAEYC